MNKPTKREMEIAEQHDKKMRPIGVERRLAFARTLADYRMELAKVAKDYKSSFGDPPEEEAIAKAIENYGND